AAGRRARPARRPPPRGRPGPADGPGSVGRRHVQRRAPGGPAPSRCGSWVSGRRRPGSGAAAYPAGRGLFCRPRRPPGGRAGLVRPDQSGRGAGMNRAAALRSVLCGLLVAVVVGGVAGAAVAVPVTVATYVWLRRGPTTAQRLEVQRVEADLPFAADLLA